MLEIIADSFSQKSSLLQRHQQVSELNELSSKVMLCASDVETKPLEQNATHHVSTASVETDGLALRQERVCKHSDGS